MANSFLLSSTGEPTVHPDRQDPYLRLHHVTIFVRDQDLSLRFYVERLGFTLVVDYRFGEHSRFVLVAPPDGTALIALVAPKPGSEEYEHIGQPGSAVFVTDDINAKFQLWRERGVPFRHSPQATAWGGMLTTFEDLDGNSFALVGWDDISREIEARRRAIAERLESERRAAQELEIAKQVQARLFPQTSPRFKTLAYAGICIQAREVGGDYYDFLDLGKQRLGLVIADVSGKGIAAALIMANLQAILRSQFASASDHPHEFLQAVNQLFYDNTNDSTYATLFFAEYDESRRSLKYANCGHLSALFLRRDQTLERLNSTCTVLGLFKEWQCSIGERSISSGDTLVLYTDGVTECFNDAGEEFGEDRLIEILRRHNELPAQGLLTAIVAEVSQFSSRAQHDDITLIVAKCEQPRSVLSPDQQESTRIHLNV